MSLFKCLLVASLISQTVPAAQGEAHCPGGVASLTLRVVQGALRLSPHLGKRMVAGSINDRSVFIRELLPQDLKIEIESLTVADAMKAASFMAGVVGKAHARQLDAGARQAWSKELARQRSKTLDAPNWLWSAVVELIGRHEVAYLEHCRRYASQTAIS